MRTPNGFASVHAMTNSHDNMLRKVMALLDKAESTTFQDEADAFVAKAQALIARHGIEEAVERARLGRPIAGDAIIRIVPLQRPYVRPKAVLLSAIGQANGCKVILRDEECVVIGFESDVDVVEMLFASLLTQSVTSMEREVRRQQPQRVKAFKNAFLLGFANEVGHRLAEATKLAKNEYEAETGTSTALVLVDRDKLVAQKAAEEFPNTVTRRTSVSNRAGLNSGRDAGSRADIGNSKVGAGTRGAIGR